MPQQENIPSIASLHAKVVALLAATPLAESASQREGCDKALYVHTAEFGEVLIVLENGNNGTEAGGICIQKDWSRLTAGRSDAGRWAALAHMGTEGDYIRFSPDGSADKRDPASLKLVARVISAIESSRNST